MPNKTLLDVYQQPDDYDQVHGKGSEDADFWVALCQRLKPASVLELATGTGRLLLPLARAGFDVTGIDVVSAMLEGAARAVRLEAPDVQARVKLALHDMRDVALGARYDLVFIGYNSVLHLLTAADREATFRAAFDHTAPGGRFAIDVFNPDLAMLAAAQRSATAGELEMALEDPAQSRRVFRSASHRYDDATQTMTTHYVTDEMVRGVSRPSVEETVDYHIYFGEEVRLLLHQAGFLLESSYGGYGFEPFEGGCPRIIMVGRRDD